MVDKKTGIKPKAKSSKPKAASEQKEPKTTEGDSKDAKTQTVKVAPKEKVVDEKPIAKASLSPPKSLAKAGKHAPKALREAKAEQERQERKKTTTEEAAKPKALVKPPRSRLERAGKKYREAAKLIEKGRVYDLPEAIELAIKTSPVKFDASVEMHFNLSVDPKIADQNVRDTLNLPSGTGKTLKVAVLAEDQDIKKAQAVGADIVGGDDFLAKLDRGELDFDILITTSALMPRLGKYAKILGPKGLMPNPKSGTITADIAGTVKLAKTGKVEYRVDQAGIVHLAIGKVSFGKDKLLTNAEAVVASLKAAKPSSLKGLYIKSAYVTTSMGPSIKLALS